MATGTPTLDFRALGSRILRPDRSGLPHVRAVLADVTDPAEAWEILESRGLGPALSSGSLPRTFGDLVLVGDPRRGDATLRMIWRNHPPTVDACVALASDPTGVPRAEALARDFTERTRPWGWTPPEGVGWRVARTDTDVAPWAHGIPIPLFQRMRALVARSPDLDAAYHRVRAAVLHGAGRTDAAVRAAARDAGRYQVARLAWPDHPNPFAPLIEIWSLGYGLDGVSTESVTLMAPRPQATQGMGGTVGTMATGRR